MPNWQNPLDLYHSLKTGECDEPTYIQRLEELQRRLSREIVPVASDSPLNPPQIPSVVPFVNVIVPPFAAGHQGVLLLREDTNVVYDTFHVDAIDTEQNGQFNIGSQPVEVWCNDNFAGFVHSGARVVFPGAKKWELRNNSAGAHNVTCYLMAGGVSIDAGLKIRLMYAQSNNSDQIFRPLQVSANTEKLLVSFGNLPGDDAAGNSDLYLSSQETSEGRGTLTGIAAGTYTIVTPPASTSLVVMALKFCVGGAFPPVGDVIQCDWKFSGGSTFWSQRFDNLNGNFSDMGQEIVFGVTGPKGNASSSLQAVITHPGGGADGWSVFALTRYISGL
jgi:hypothetical protein